MKTIARILLTVLAALLWVSIPSAEARELLFSQNPLESARAPSLNLLPGDATIPVLTERVSL
jgi:hypothetical protein